MKDTVFGEHSDDRTLSLTKKSNLISSLQIAERLGLANAVVQLESRWWFEEGRRPQ